MLSSAHVLRAGQNHVAIWPPFPRSSNIFLSEQQLPVSSNTSSAAGTWRYNGDLVPKLSYYSCWSGQTPWTSDILTAVTKMSRVPTDTPVSLLDCSVDLFERDLYSINKPVKNLMDGDLEIILALVKFIDPYKEKQ